MVGIAQASRGRPSAGRRRTAAVRSGSSRSDARTSRQRAARLSHESPRQGHRGRDHSAADAGRTQTPAAIAGRGDAADEGEHRRGFAGSCCAPTTSTAISATSIGCAPRGVALEAHLPGPARARGAPSRRAVERRHRATSSTSPSALSRLQHVMRELGPDVRAARPPAATGDRRILLAAGAGRAAHLRPGDGGEVLPPRPAGTSRAAPTDRATNSTRLRRGARWFAVVGLSLSCETQHRGARRDDSDRSRRRRVTGLCASWSAARLRASVRSCVSLVGADATAADGPRRSCRPKVCLICAPRAC